MVKGLAWASLACLLCAVSASAQDAKAPDAKLLLQAADQAIGASKVNSLAYTGTGWVTNVGQSYSTTTDGSRLDLKSWSEAIDYPGKSMREEEVRIQGLNPPLGGGAPYPLSGEARSNTQVSGDYAWTVNAQGRLQPQNGQAAGRQFDIWTTPHGFIKAALAAPNVTVMDRVFVNTGKMGHLIGFNIGRQRLVGEFDDQNLLNRVFTWIPNTMMGDMEVEIRYSDWRDLGNGIKAPFHIHEDRGSHPLWRENNYRDIQASDVKVNVQTAALMVPDAVRNAPAQRQGGPEYQLSSLKVGDGVWLIRTRWPEPPGVGNPADNSVAIEFKDFAVVVEAAAGDAWVDAVFAETRRLIPGKPIKYVINTHHHWDHSGGIRAAYAYGATIVTNEMNRDFYERVMFAPQPRTLSPDHLSQFPLGMTDAGPGKLVYYRDSYTITDGDQSVTCYHVDSNHAADMAIVYLPKIKAVITGDMWTPLPPNGEARNISPNAPALYTAIKALRLDVQTQLAIHGDFAGPESDFERIVAPIVAKQRLAGEGG